jgi:hypothetical protein
MTGVIHQDLPHRPHGDAQEVSTILPADMFVVDEFDIGLVNQRRRLEGVVGSLVLHEPGGSPVHLLVDGAKETILRSSIAGVASFAELAENPRDV